VSIDAIQSVQVNVSNYDVTQTGYTGGNINAVTKSGTNDFHGSLTYVFRDDSMAGDRYNRSNDTYTPRLRSRRRSRGHARRPDHQGQAVLLRWATRSCTARATRPTSADRQLQRRHRGHLAGRDHRVQNLAQTQYKHRAGRRGASGGELIVKDYLAKTRLEHQRQHRANLRYTKTEQSSRSSRTSRPRSSLEHQPLAPGQDDRDARRPVVRRLDADLLDRAQGLEPRLPQRADQPTTLAEMRFSYPARCPPGARGGQPGTRTLFTGTERSRHFNILDTKTDDLYFGANWTHRRPRAEGPRRLQQQQDLQRLPAGHEGPVHVQLREQRRQLRYSFGAINCGTATAAQVEAAVLENFQRGRPSSYLVQVPLNAGGSLADGVATFKLENEGFARAGHVDGEQPNLTMQFGSGVDTPT
jgi:hypothetical protein